MHHRTPYIKKKLPWSRDVKCEVTYYYRDDEDGYIYRYVDEITWAHACRNIEHAVNEMTAYAGVAKNLETGQIYTVSEEDRRITDSSEDTSSGAKLLLNEGVKRLGFGSYQEFLLSSLWIQRRRSWWSKYPHSVCAVCDVKGKLLLHHKTYERLGCERDEDLCPLCPRCHGQVHTHAVITGGRFSTAVERYRKATTLQGKEEKIGD